MGGRGREERLIYRGGLRVFGYDLNPFQDRKKTLIGSLLPSIHPSFPFFFCGLYFKNHATPYWGTVLIWARFQMDWDVIES